MSAHEPWKKSQLVMLTALAVVASTIIATTGLVRISVSEAAPGNTAVELDNGEVATQQFDLKDFDSIEISGQWDVTLVQGSAWQVDVSHPKNMPSELQVAVNDGKLQLRTEWRKWGSNNHDRHLTARIVMPVLAAVTVSGAAKIDMADFSGDRLNIAVSGAAEVNGRNGHYNDLSVTVSGAGHIDMPSVVAVNARVNLSGAGSIEIGMDGGELSGSLSGVGNIRYHGTVSNERVTVSGLGKVRHAN